MSVKKLYYSVKTNISFTGYSFLKLLLLPVILLLSTQAMAYDVAPVFSGGPRQGLSVCINSGATNIDYLLTINALASGENETWSVYTPAVHGTLSGFSTSDTTTGSALTPSGLTYAPVTGYSGADSFTIIVSDGFDTAYTTVIVTVHPLPTLNSSLTPGSVCTGTPFTYTGTSSNSGVTLSWSRPLEAGISNAPASGTASIDETLNNVTYYDETVTYIYTLVAYGCSNREDVNVVVKPAPRLSGTLTYTVCNGEAFDFTPAGSTPGTTFAWTLSAPGLSPSSGSGTGEITQAFINSTSATQTATYVFTLDADGCYANRDVTVAVAPPVPAVINITTESPSSVCLNTLYQNFGTSVAPDSGVNYTWGVQNAAIYAEGANSQFILVNFNEPGTALVTLTANVPGTACYSVDSYTVSVGATASSTASIIYNDEQFVYLDNTDSTYQWGYDNAATLDSTLITGATFQSFPDSTPDFTDNYYWVITTKNGCMAKTYYNAPQQLAVKTVSAAETGIKVYPNPATDAVNVGVYGLQSGSTATVIVSDMMGRTLQTTTGTQQIMQFNIAAMPAGCYLVTCYSNGMRVATARFIKK